MKNHKLSSLALLGLLLSMLTAGLRAQVPPAPPEPSCPCPTGTVNAVRINGNIMEGMQHMFFDDGTWAMWTSDRLVGWGTWEFGSAPCTIDYVNRSLDGGGNQTGTFTWDDTSHEWQRTAASHPDAPPMSLVPPL